MDRYERGKQLLGQGQPQAALVEFEQVLRQRPEFASAWFNAANALLVLGRFSQAVDHFQQTLRLEPHSAEAHNNLAVAWIQLGRYDEAIASGQQAVALNPRYALAHDNLAGALQALGRLDEAMPHHRRAVELEPASSSLHSNLLYALNFQPGHDPAEVFAEHRAWAERHADPLTAAAAPHANDRTPERRLRVGYVSPHFKTHAVNYFVEPILAAHDHQRFEVFCYSDTGPGDATTTRLRSYADAWRETLGASHEQLAALVRQDAIDILVDLTGHIAGGPRMLTFARKPAPVQVTYIGYQNTTGMAAMGYRLTDAYADPPGPTDRWHTEQLVRLPRSFFCYQPAADAPQVAPSPAAGNGYLMFGSINNFVKVTPAVLDAWAEILLRVPRAKLVILAHMTDGLRGRLRNTFAARGVDGDRLELIGYLQPPEYFDLINRIDVGLDAFPFNGHTTTCDLLWQGVPVVTLSGETYASRFGGSGIATLGLQDWIAESRQQYVEIAVRMAGQVDRLATLRTTLRQRMAASPLLDFASFTRNLEAAYRRMWTAWCAR